jgi:hypothetical protein
MVSKYGILNVMQIQKAEEGETEEGGTCTLSVSFLLPRSMDPVARRALCLLGLEDVAPRDTGAVSSAEI